MLIGRMHAWGTVVVLAVVIFGDLYDFTHGGVLESKGTLGSSCVILDWFWFFITIAFLPFMIMNKQKIKGAVTYLAGFPILVVIWFSALYQHSTPVAVPAWLYFSDIAANCLIAAVCLSTLPSVGRFFAPLPKKS
jgi:hypothetical protein